MTGYPCTSSWEAPCDILRPCAMCAYDFTWLNIPLLHVLTMAELDRPSSSAGTNNSFVIPPLRALGASARSLSRRFGQSMSDLFYDAEEPGRHCHTFLCYWARGGGPCDYPPWGLGRRGVTRFFYVWGMVDDVLCMA